MLSTAGSMLDLIGIGYQLLPMTWSKLKPAHIHPWCAVVMTSGQGYSAPTISGRDKYIAIGLVLRVEA